MTIRANACARIVASSPHSLRQPKECRNVPDQKRTRLMKQIAAVALMVHLAVAGTFAAEERSANVRMTASGDMLATTINLQDHTITDEETLAGDGTLGAFTYHGLRSDADTPQIPDPPATCATPLSCAVTTGGGVVRFDDGSLLVVNVKGGGICIDLAAGM